VSLFDPFWKIAEQLARFSESEKAIIENKLIYREIPAKYRLVDIDETATEAYFLLEGFARFYYITEEAEEVTGFIFGPGQFFSSLESLFTGAPSQQTVESITACKILAFKKSDLDAWMDDIRPMDILVRKLLIQRLIYAQSVVASLISLKPEERYMNMMESRPDLVQHIPQHILSSFIGITPVSLSRIRKRITEKG